MASQISHPNDSFDYLFKVILIGDSGVGKSSLLTRYSRNEFNSETKTTIGVEFATSLVNIDDKNIKVTLWDTAGQERFRAATSAYYRNTLGAFIVYDITNRTTFQNVNSWIKELSENVDKVEDLCLTLIGNKCDLRHLRAISRNEAQDLAQANGMHFIETSALDCINIETTFKDMVTGIYKKIEAEIEAACNSKDKAAKTVNLNINDGSSDDGNKCCSLV